MSGSTRCAIATLLVLAAGAASARDREPALQALHGITPLQAAALSGPAAQAALSDSLRAAGWAPARTLPALIDQARAAAMGGGAWHEPVLSVGPFVLSVPQVLLIVGPREGRDRNAVAARLRLVAPEAARGMTTGALVALVPDLVAAADGADVGTVLDRLRVALATQEAPQ